MAFYDDIIFPLDISYGSRGGPMWNTDVVITNSGYEVRNQRWVNTRHSYNAAYGVKTPQQMANVIDIFHSVRGKLHGFLYCDPQDNNSTNIATFLGDVGTNSDTTHLDQNLGTGTGSLATFDLRKRYFEGSGSYYRPIYKPIPGTTLLGIGGVNVTSDWSISGGTITIENRTGTVTGVTTGATTVVTLNTVSGLSVGGSLYITGTSGVTGLNNTRSLITGIAGNNVTLARTTTGTWTSGGTSSTLPVSGEAVTAGFEFYVPVRFDTDSLSTVFDNYRSLTTSVDLVEIRL